MVYKYFTVRITVTRGGKPILHKNSDNEYVRVIHRIIFYLVLK